MCTGTTAAAAAAAAFVCIVCSFVYHPYAGYLQSFLKKTMFLGYMTLTAILWF
jgi:hypothetical protein